ncbi:MAG: SUMF1/EgtB/PvdO family nonheme iron enzyme, partial [Candidatus Hydrogenedentota bacterium]
KEGIIHRDIKPQNIMIDRAGRVKVMDFGLARAVQASTQLTAQGTRLGTPMYMSPEQCQGKDIDGRTDIYSLGVTLYEMLAGRPPFEADTPLALMYQITHEPMLPVEEFNSDVPPIAAQVIADMTARERDQRYPSTDVLAMHLAAMLRGEAPPPLENIPVPKRPKKAKPGSIPAPRAAAPTQPQPARKSLSPHLSFKRIGVVGMALGTVILLVIGAKTFLSRFQEPMEDGWESVFNGDDLSGWEPLKGEPLHTGTEPWVVTDGAIMTPGDRSLLRTKKEWTDFELELDYRTAGHANGGVYLRGRVEFQISVGESLPPEKTHGAVYGQYAALTDATRPGGEWNRLEARLEGRTLTVQLNGSLIHDHVEVAPTGVSPIDGELEDPGPLVLQSFVGTVWYRNIRLRPLAGPASQASEPRVGDVGTFAGIEMCFVPGGTFTMGSKLSAEEAAKLGGSPSQFARDLPAHQVTLKKGFWIGRYEVTNGQFKAFVKETDFQTEAEKEGWGLTFVGGERRRAQGANWRNPGWTIQDTQPVVLVSWQDAQAFIRWLNDKGEGHFRLPTEAEWEYASRAGTTTLYPWGDDPAAGEGWCNGADLTSPQSVGPSAFPWIDGYVYPAPVGTFRPNNWGLYDVVGNVCEWCNDWYSETYYKDSPETDPKGPSSGTHHVVRGGSWANDAAWSRLAHRHWGPEGRFSPVGFRVARDE